MAFPELSVVEHLRHRVPGLLAVYAFGSRMEGTAGPQSDWDLAVLVSGYADPVLLWDVAGELADLLGTEVDLLDFRAASTVMQHQILTRGQRWWARDVGPSLFEAAVLSEMTDLNERRAPLMADIARRGSVHGR
ncbi:MAG: type VII toxin-antitoxin system MntA family adenylyltransferase antitoxin [Burkholderiaceae bacterium]